MTMQQQQSKNWLLFLLMATAATLVWVDMRQRFAAPTKEDKPAPKQTPSAPTREEAIQSWATLLLGAGPGQAQPGGGPSAAAAPALTLAAVPPFGLAAPD